MKWKYSCCGEALCIEDVQSKQLVWQGRLEGHTVQKVITMPVSDDCVLLLCPPSGWRPFANLWRYSHKNGIIWQAELPSSTAGDTYIDFEMDENGLTAWSWSAFRVGIDLTSGRILSTQFTK